MKKYLRVLCILSLAVSSGAWAQLTGTTVATNRVQVAPSTTTSWTDILVTCPAGLTALSGGVDTNDFNFFEVTTLAPTFAGAALAFQADGTRSAPDGWYASVKNYDSVAHPVSMAVSCATVTGAISSVSSGTASGGTRAAPGNGAAVGGVKVVTKHAWFAARPSGTEDVYKIYAESFLGAEHLTQVQAEAKKIVDAALHS